MSLELDDETRAALGWGSAAEYDDKALMGSLMDAFGNRGWCIRDPARHKPRGAKAPGIDKRTLPQSVETKTTRTVNRAAFRLLRKALNHEAARRGAT